MPSYEYPLSKPSIEIKTMREPLINKERQMTARFQKKDMTARFQQQQYKIEAVMMEVLQQ